MKKVPTNLNLPVKLKEAAEAYASYRLALIKDIQELALEMGNSPRMIYTHYLDLKHEDEAQKWFGIRPSTVWKDLPAAEANA